MKNSLLSLARKFRKNQTPTEFKIWSKLRGRRLLNYKFYRQVTIGNYIVDFCCRKKKLIIEIDGGGHNYPNQIKKDIIRDKFLKNQGYKVLHIWSNQVENNMDGVLERIMKQLERD